MNRKKVEKRLEKLKEDILLGKIAEPYGAVGIHKSGEEFTFKNLSEKGTIDEIIRDRGFTAQALRTGDFSGQYWVRLDCNPDIPGFECKLIAEIDTTYGLEDLESELHDDVDRNLERTLCENTHYPNLCRKAVSLGVMSQFDDSMMKAIRESVKYELEEYFDKVEMRKGGTTLAGF